MKKELYQILTFSKCSVLYHWWNCLKNKSGTHCDRISCCLCRHTHELKLHQLLVRVCGWEQVKPVSVDKVGVFFRYAAPDRNNSSSTVSISHKDKNKIPVHRHRLVNSLLLNMFYSPPLIQVGSPISRTNIIHPHVYVSLARHIVCCLNKHIAF